MRQLYLLRHAKSNWDDPGLDDFDRPLSGRGRSAARAIGRHLKHDHVRPALILCSAARRTAETLELIESGVEGVPVSIEPELYEASKHDLMVRLRRLDDNLGSVMLIGHNPGLERLAETLSAHHGDGGALARMAGKFPTGGLAVLTCAVARWAELDDGTCSLELADPARRPGRPGMRGWG